MHSINILPNKPDIVPDDSYVNSLNSLKTVLSKFELTNWKFLSVQINLFWFRKKFDFLCFKNNVSTAEIECMVASSDRDSSVLLGGAE